MNTYLSGEMSPELQLVWLEHLNTYPAEQYFFDLIQCIYVTGPQKTNTFSSFSAWERIQTQLEE